MCLMFFLWGFYQPGGSLYFTNKSYTRGILWALTFVAPSSGQNLWFMTKYLQNHGTPINLSYTLCLVLIKLATLR